MSSQTSLVARNYRLQQWAAQIQDCQNRPEGMLVNDWCRQHNITKANYYYRLKCVRQACLDSMPETATGFVELQVPTDSATVPESTTGTSAVSAVIHTRNGLAIDLYDSASADFLQKLLGAATYAE
jgi:hypothetical protein